MRPIIACAVDGNCVGMEGGPSVRLGDFDHMAITTGDLEACLHFYVDVLGMEPDRAGGRYAVRFGARKINIHTRPAEFLPAASVPTPGSLDLCLAVDEPIEDVRREVGEKGWPIELGPVERHGARGPMHSIYLRDPDGNLIELASYDDVEPLRDGEGRP